MIDLACNADRGPVQVGDISRRQNISVKYLEQLLRPLKQADIITSVRGPKGGHLLTKSPAEITLGEIVRLFETDHERPSMFCYQEDCTEMESCLLNLTWQQAMSAFYEELDTTTIADLEKECSDLRNTRD